MANTTVNKTESNQSQFSVFDSILILVASAVFGTVSYFIWDKQTFYQTFMYRNADEESIAKISYVDRDVRRKVASELVWIPASENDGLGDNSMVFTGSASGARVEFEDGGEFFLESDSLVIVTKAGERTTLSVKQGALSGKLGKKTQIEVQTDGKKKTLDGKGSEVRLRFDGKDNTEITTLKGSLRVQGQEGVSEIKANESLEIKKTKAKKTRLNLALLSPTINQRFWTSSKVIVNFSWEKIAQADAYQLSIYNDPNKKQLKTRKKLKKSELGWRIKNQFGRYYWEVKAFGGDEILGSSALASFSINEEKAPETIFPPMNANFSTKKMKTKKLQEETYHEMRFAWKYRSPFSKAVLQVAKDVDFNEIVMEKQVSGTREDVYLTAGQFFWRVKNDHDQRFALWSFPSGFSILKPREIKRLALKANTSSQVYFLTGSPAEVGFKIQMVPEITKYQLEIASEPNFKKESVLVNKTLDSDELKLRFKKAGNFYWRVKGRNPASSVVGESSARSFFIKSVEKLNAPQIRQELKNIVIPAKRLKKRSPKRPDSTWIKLLNTVFPAAHAQEGLAAVIDWEDVEGSVEYEIEFARDEAFQDILLSKRTKESQFELVSLDPGVYYWRVAGVDEDGFVGEKSEVGKITVLAPEKRPNSPTITRIPSEEIPKDQTTAITIAWEGQASRFRLQLSDSRDFSRFYQNRVMTEKSFEVIASQIPYDQLYVRVAGINSESAQGAFSSVKLIKFKEVAQEIPVPTIRSPKNKKIFLLTKSELSKKIQLQWGPIPDTTYRLQIDTFQNFENPRIERVFKKNTIPLAARNLIGKLVFWRVRAERGDVKGPWSEKYSFRVKLKRKTYSAPITARSTKEIYVSPRSTFEANFNWDPEEGVDGYLLAIATDKDFKNIQDIQFVKGNDVAVELPNNQRYFWKMAVGTTVSSNGNDKKIKRLSDYTEVKTFKGVKREHYIISGSFGLLDFSFNQGANPVSDRLPQGDGETTGQGISLELEYHPLMWENWWFRGHVWANSTLPVRRFGAEVMREFRFGSPDSFEWQASVGAGVGQWTDYYFLNATTGGTTFEQDFRFAAMTPVMFEAQIPRLNLGFRLGANVFHDTADLGERVISPLVNVRYFIDSVWVGLLYTVFERDFQVETITADTQVPVTGNVEIGERLLALEVGYSF